MCETLCTEALRCNIDKIISCIQELRLQRNELSRIIRKQEEEKAELAIEFERLNYKLNNLNKSLAQRGVQRDRYNQVIVEAEEYYNKLVESSQELLIAVERDFGNLYERMDKKVGPDNT